MQCTYFSPTHKSAGADKEQVLDWNRSLRLELANEHKLFVLNKSETHFVFAKANFFLSLKSSSLLVIQNLK